MAEKNLERRTNIFGKLYVGVKEIEDIIIGYISGRRGLARLNLNLPDNPISALFGWSYTNSLYKERKEK